MGKRHVYVVVHDGEGRAMVAHGPPADEAWMAGLDQAFREGSGVVLLQGWILESDWGAYCRGQLLEKE